MICRRISLCVFCAAAVWLCVLYSELANSQVQPISTTAQFSLPVITEAELSVFRDSMRSGIAFTPFNPEIRAEADPALVGMWAGSRTTVDWNMDSVVLRFAPRDDTSAESQKAIGRTAEGLRESFDVQISFKGRRFELRHSAADPRSGGGFSMSVDQPGIGQGRFVDGDKGSGLYAAIPLIADSEQGWGALVCPRTISKVRHERSTVPVLISSPYKLSEAQALVSVRADARFSTAGAEGRARVSVAVTGGLLTSNPDFDQAASASPQVDLFYNPRSRMPFFSLAGLAGRQEGVRMLVEMQNSAGYVRKQYFLQAVAIQRIDEPISVPVFVDGRGVPSDQGECYVVIVRRNRWSTYGREKPLF